MFLRQVELHNIRCIEHLKLDFGMLDADGMPVTTKGQPKTRKWTMILGQNGTGKSSILRSISLLVSGSQAMPELLAEPDSWIRNGENEARISADLVTSDNEQRKVSLKLVRGHNVRQVFDENSDAMDSIDNALSHSNRNYFLVGYGASRRLATARSISSAEAFRHVRAQSVSTLFSPDAVLNPLDAWAIDLEYRKGQAGVDTVREALADLLPNIRFSHIDRDRKDLIFDTPDGKLPLTQLSDGYQNVAAWCGDLLYRVTSIFENYTNPFSARGLLLIDEIDLHLHPVWQRRLREFLTNKLPNFQVLATTHSPLTAQQSGAGELYSLNRLVENEPPVLEPFLGTPNLLLAHQILASPAFGVETLDSVRVQEMKETYKRLKGKTDRSKAEDKELKDVSAQLRDLPSWGAPIEPPAELKQIVKDIKQSLQADSKTRK